MNVSKDDLWSETEITIDDVDEVEREPKERNDEKIKFGNSSNRNLVAGVVPINYNNLFEMGYRIMSERRAGMEEYESKYDIVPLDTKITKIEAELLGKRILTNKPSFLKIYFSKRENGALFVLVKERFGKKVTIFSKIMPYRM